MIGVTIITILIVIKENQGIMGQCLYFKNNLCSNNRKHFSNPLSTLLKIHYISKTDSKT